MSGSKKLMFTAVEGKEEVELLEKYFVNKICHGHVRCEGVTMPDRFQKFAEEILNLEVRDDDIWVCSFPKTGTTWTQEMVWCIKNDVNLERAKAMLAEERSPLIEMSAIVNYDKICHLHPSFKPPPFVKDSVNFVKSLPSPRFIKTHLPLHLLPLQLQQGTTKAKIVYVAREVKDTCVSYYYHHRFFGGTQASLDQFASLFMKDAVVWAPFWDHLKGFWSRRSDLKILFLKYEEMQKDLPSVVRKTAAFLDKRMTDEQIKILCDHLSFEQMKNNKALNFEGLIELNKKFDIVSGEERFMRNGKVGDWKTKFSPERVQQFKDWTEKHLQGTDLGLYYN